MPRTTRATPPTGPVVFRCDIGPAVGVGHLMRCLALAEELAARGHDVVFSADVASVPFAAAQLSARGLAHVAAPDTRDGHLAMLAGIDPAAVVLDSYRLAPEVYAAVRDAGHRTLALVDGDPAGREADLYLDQNVGAEQDSWTLPSGATRLAGLEYCLIRDEILRRRPAGPDDHVEADPARVLAFFGGTDAFGAAPVLARALIATARPFALTVVAARDDVRRELAASALRTGQSIEAIPPSDRLADLVHESDLVVSAAGTSSWELLCLGAAAAFVCVAENQRESYERVEALGLSGALGLLDDLRTDAGPATAELARLLDHADERRRIRRAGWSRVDGRGRARVADALLPASRLV